jgi:hypothetical protein
MRLDAFGLVATLVLGTFILSPIAEAQQPARLPTVGVLHPGFPPPAAVSPLVAGLRDGLRELGYVEGRTISIEYRWARGKPDTLPGLAAELVRLKVDVLVAPSLSAVRAARDAAGSEPLRLLPSLRDVCRPDPQGRETCRPSRRTAHEVRARHQLQGGDCAEPDAPGAAAPPGGRGDSITSRTGIALEDRRLLPVSHGARAWICWASS